MKKTLFFTFVFALFLIVGCSTNDIEPVDSDLLIEDATLDQLSRSENSKKPQPAIWADCETFGSLATKSHFKPTAGNFDELYNGANFKDGLGAISESKPGDQDFNGGRWHVNTLKEGVDPNKYWSACSVEDLYGIDSEFWNDFNSTDVYFECPMLPVN